MVQAEKDATRAGEGLDLSLATARSEGFRTLGGALPFHDREHVPGTFSVTMDTVLLSIDIFISLLIAGTHSLTRSISHSL